MDLGFALGLVSRAGLGAAGGSVQTLGPVLDADPLYQGPTLDAGSVVTSYRAWVDDPAYARGIGRYQSGGPYMGLQDKLFADIFTFGRASTATDYDASGVLNTVAAGNIRQGFDPVTKAPLGWLLEGAATNGCRNPRAEGAIAGAPGTLPTFWQGTTTGGAITRNVVGAGTEAGLPYIDVQYQFSGAGVAYVGFEANAGWAVPAAVSVAQSCYVRLMAGSLAGLTVQLRTSFRDSGGAGIIEPSTDIVPTGAALATQRYARVDTSPANTVSAFGLVRLVATGTADATIRLAGPMIEQNYFASSVILPPVSAPAATTRQPDALTIDGARFQTIFGLGRSVTNLLPRSDAFDDAAWSKFNASVTPQAGAAPDGTTAADKFVLGNTGGGSATVSQAAPSAPDNTLLTFSVYAKAAEYSTLPLVLSDKAATFRAATFDLAAGTVIGLAGGATANIVSVGSGWYRLSVTSNSGTGGNSIRPTIGSNWLQGDGAGGVLIWGAQLETAPATPAANLLTMPEAFNNGSWARNAATVATFGGGAAPDGGTADKLVEDGTNAGHNIWQGRTLAAGAHTFSVYVKAAGRSQVRITGYNATDGNAIVANISLTDGTSVAANTGTITTTSAGGGWWRIVCTATFSAAYTQFFISPMLGGTTNYQGNGTDGIAIWGASLVQASAAPTYQPLSSLVSSYIPTGASAVTKTHVPEGAVILDVMMPQTAATAGGFNAQSIAQLVDGSSTTNRISIAQTNGGAAIAGTVWNSGQQSFTPSAGNIVAGVPFRAGIRWGPGPVGGIMVGICLNGGAVQTQYNVPSLLSQLYIGNNPAGTSSLNGRVRLVRALAYAPSDSEFQARCTLGA